MLSKCASKLAHPLRKRSDRHNNCVCYCQVNVNKLSFLSFILQDDNKTVVRLKRYISLCGVRLNYKKLLDGCRSVRSQVAVLKKELEGLGVDGQCGIRSPFNRHHSSRVITFFFHYLYHASYEE